MVKEYFCDKSAGQFRRGRIYRFEAKLPVLARSAVIAGVLRKLEVVGKPVKRGRKRPFKQVEVELPEVVEDGEAGL
jgi:hypothetical protein